MVKKIVIDPRAVGYINKLKSILLERAVKRGNFKLSAGSDSTYYIDCRKASMYAKGMKAIGEAIIETIIYADTNGDLELGFATGDKTKSLTAVCGPESAGIPLVCAIVSATSYFADIEGCFVRKETKEHGTKSRIEGYELTKKDRVLVVEDVATTGTSIIKTIDAIRETGAEIVAVIVLVDRLQGASEKIESMEIPYKALLTIKDLGLV